MRAAAELAGLVARLESARVVCIGDVMLDRFVYGAVDRISPEAPIAVLNVEQESTVLGGAGNVVRNLVALGAEVCFLSVVGDDHAGRELTELVGGETGIEPHLLVEARRRTTIKTRFVAATQQLLRADRETKAPIRESLAADLVRRATEAIEERGPGAVLILSDYGKGVLTAEVTVPVIEAARRVGATVIVDPKGRDYARYAGASLVTPNRRELMDATGMPAGTDDEVEAAARHLLAVCGFEAVLVTRSQDGMSLVRKDGEARHLPAEAREVFDVSGAGDTVVATLGAAFGGGLTLEDACALANVTAGIVVAKIGTAVCHRQEAVDALHARDLMHGQAKLVERPALIQEVAAWRRQGLKVGFTNGCFDLLHPGHVSLLSQARAACDRLVVGLNSDASVKRLKGPTRPVQDQDARAAVMASLSHVDAVTIFDEDTPLALIEAIRPDVLVKGADYTVDTVVGADIVQSYGGEILLAQLTPGQSTTSMVAKIAG